jgi:MFS family permease
MPGFSRKSKTLSVSGMDIFRSLQHRNFRLFYSGQLISMIGTWMQIVVQAWLVYRLTQSSFMLGLVSATALAPILIFGLHGGLLADRLSRYRLFIITQVLAMIQALTLCVLTLTGLVQPWHILLLAFLLGMVHALEMPARHSFIAQLVSREDLPNAVALNASLIHLARFIGPAIAGWLVVWVGEGFVFLINGVTFLAVIVALLAMRLPGRAQVVGRQQRARGLLEGVHFAWRDNTIRYPLSMVGMVSLVGTSAAILMPVFVTQVFHSGAQTLGLLLGIMGGGSLVGALTLARCRQAVGLVSVIGRGGIGGGIALTLFAFTQELWMALLILPVIGFSLTMVIAASNAIIQLSVPNHLRGRVMSLYTMTFHGLMPLGILMVGGLADYSGAPFTVAACGVFLLIAASAFTFLASVKKE